MQLRDALVRAGFAQPIEVPFGRPSRHLTAPAGRDTAPSDVEARAGKHDPHLVTAVDHAEYERIFGVAFP